LDDGGLQKVQKAIHVGDYGNAGDAGKQSIKRETLIRLGEGGPIRKKSKKERSEKGS